MKKNVILSFACLLFAACGGNIANQPTANKNVAPNNQAQNTGDSAVLSSHSTETKTTQSNSTIVPKSETKTKWTQSGDPIDTTSFDSEIKQVQDKIKANPKDESLKKSLAGEYVKRGLALTDVRQYASALGDYRRALKLDPTNEEAKKWVDQIISIYNSINKEYPKEGEEPPPLPFKKQ